MKTISPKALKPKLTAGDEIAFLDIREHGQYGEGHPFFSVSLPFSVLEARAPVLVPRSDTPVVLMDDGDGVALFRCFSVSGKVHTDEVQTILRARRSADGPTNWRHIDLDGGVPRRAGD